MWVRLPPPAFMPKNFKDPSVIIVATFGGLLIGILFGLFTGWILWPVQYMDIDLVDLYPHYKDEFALLVSYAYALDGDLEAASKRLEEAGIVNPGAFLASLAESYLAQGQEIPAKRLALLAEALGYYSSNPQIVALIATPTPTPTFTPTPTNTPTPTPTFTPSPTPTNTPIPTPTPTRPPATPTPRPTRPPTPTPTPAPPTPTPTPTVDFKIVTQRILTIQENGGCGGNHNIYVQVIDANGAPLDGIVVHGIWTKQDYITQEELWWAGAPYGDRNHGRTNIPLWKAGEQVFVKGDVTGRSYTSEVSRVLDTRTANIPIEDLIAGGYCSSPEDCRHKLETSPICDGHYSYLVIFQRQW